MGRSSRRPRTYFSLRSPYSWLAYCDLLQRYPDIAAQLEWLPFWEPDETTDRMLTAAGVEFVYVQMSRAKHLYILQDVRRLATARGLPVVWPVDRRPCWEVPHLAYLAAAEHGRGQDFMAAAYRARWLAGRDICDRKVIAELAVELGLEEDRLANAADSVELRTAGVAALAAAERDGAFGVPFFVNGHDKYWGVDRLPDFVAAIGAGEHRDQPAPRVTSLDRASDQGHAGGCG